MDDERPNAHYVNLDERPMTKSGRTSQKKRKRHGPWQRNNKRGYIGPASKSGRVQSKGRPSLNRIAREMSLRNGTSFREEYEKARLAREAEDREWRKDNAPRCRKGPTGEWERVSDSLEYPYGVDDDGNILFPYGKHPNGWAVVRPEDAPENGFVLPTSPSNGMMKDSLIEKLERIGCDPIEGIAHIAMNEKVSVETRLRAFTELAGFIYPKKRAVEHTGEQKQQVFVIAVPGEKPRDADAWLREVKPNGPLLEHEATAPMEYGQGSTDDVEEEEE